MLTSYRPVPNLSKLTERVADDQLAQHLKDNVLLDPRPEHLSERTCITETALLWLKSDVDLALDPGDGIVLTLSTPVLRQLHSLLIRQRSKHRLATLI